MSFFIQGELPHLITTYGYWAVGGAVALESIGIPVPGETALVAGAAIAATTHALALWIVIAAAAAGAILGDNIGFTIGRTLGYWLLPRLARHAWISERRIKLGRYLFLRHGGTVVFFGRFVAVLRELAALLAGVNRMSWPRFLVFNTAGGVIWATLYGVGAYHLGKEVSRLAEPVSIGIGIVVGLAVIAAAIFLRYRAAALEDRAEKALPGPLRPMPGKKGE
jgi:membrane protein DedA with SNARE-associated domain